MNPFPKTLSTNPADAAVRQTCAQNLPAISGALDAPLGLRSGHLNNEQTCSHPITPPRNQLERAICALETELRATPATPKLVQQPE